MMSFNRSVRVIVEKREVDDSSRGRWVVRVFATEWGYPHSAPLASFRTKAHAAKYAGVIRAAIWNGWSAP